MAMTPNRPSVPRDSDRVVMLFPRQRRTAGPPVGRRPLIKRMADYEMETDDDFRQRMTNNMLAFLVCAVLVVAGVWLVTGIVELRKVQDCALSGRSGCRPLDVPIRAASGQF